MSEPTNREPIAININRQVEVTLTEYGRRILREHYRGLHWTQPLPSGPARFTLWELMNTFGPCLFMGAPSLPFEGNAIVLLPDAHAVLMEQIDARMKEIEGQ